MHGDVLQAVKRSNQPPVLTSRKDNGKREYGNEETKDSKEVPFTRCCITDDIYHSRRGSRSYTFRSNRHFSGPLRPYRSQQLCHSC